MTRQFLIIDADDTLWENNIYFEKAFEEFCQFLDHSSMPSATFWIPSSWPTPAPTDTAR